jgi:hypothetical protein
MHDVALMHDTSSRKLLLAPNGFGLDTTDQSEPSHASTSVLYCVPTQEPPTASHDVGLTHETP